MFLPFAVRQYLGSSALMLALIVAVFGMFGCDKKSGSQSRPVPSVLSSNKEDPQWIYRDPNKPNKVAVVFVHGIFGSTQGTWTHESGTTFFQLLKEDQEIGPNIDVYAFGFESEMFGGSGSLDVREGANKLKTYLSGERVLDYDAVVFVGHSMGGLVILRYL
ncbi:MAG: alpha/beta hydrolase, partial [Hylemonella sp.]|nr:alpha/beta hydrolase [Hylemonella sp.]